MADKSSEKPRNRWQSEVKNGGGSVMWEHARLSVAMCDQSSLKMWQNTEAARWRLLGYSAAQIQPNSVKLMDSASQ